MLPFGTRQLPFLPTRQGALPVGTYLLADLLCYIIRQSGVPVRGPRRDQCTNESRRGITVPRWRCNKTATCPSSPRAGARPPIEPCCAVCGWFGSWCFLFLCSSCLFLFC